MTKKAKYTICERNCLIHGTETWPMKAEHGKSQPK